MQYAEPVVHADWEQVVTVCPYFVCAQLYVLFVIAVSRVERLMSVLEWVALHPSQRTMADTTRAQLQIAPTIVWGEGIWQYAKYPNHWVNMDSEWSQCHESACRQGYSRLEYAMTFPAGWDGEAEGAQVTWVYVANFQDMTQTNTTLQVVKPIRRLQVANPVPVLP